MRKTIWLVLMFIGLYQTAFGQSPELVVQTGHSNRVVSLEFSPQGDLLATASDTGKFGVDAFTVKIWDVASGKQLRTLHGGSKLRFSPNGEKIAIIQYQNVKLYNVSSGALVKEYVSPVAFDDLFFSPTGDTFTLRTFTSAQLAPNVFTAGHPSRKLFVIALKGNKDTVFLKDETDQKILDLHPDIGYLRGVKFSSNGDSFAVFNDEEMVIFDTTTRKIIRRIGISNSSTGLPFALQTNGQKIAFSPTGYPGEKDVLDAPPPFPGQAPKREVTKPSFYISGYGEKNTVEIWDLKTNSRVQKLSSNAADTESVAFSKEGDFLAVGNSDGTVDLWNLKKGLARRVPIQHERSVTSVAFSPDVNRLASSSGDSIKVTDFLTGDIRKLQKVEGSQGCSLAFIDDTFLAGLCLSNELVIWNQATGKIEQRYPLDSEIGKSKSKEISDKFLMQDNFHANVPIDRYKKGVAPNNLKSVKCFDPIKSKIDQVENAIGLVGGPAENFSFQNWNDIYIAHGNIGAVALGDGGVKLWNEENCEPVANLVVLNKNDWLVTTSTGLFDGTPNAWKQIIWRFSNKKIEHAPVEAYFNDFFHPSLLEEIFRGERPQPPEGKELAMRDRRRPSVTIDQVELQDRFSTGAGGSAVSTNRRNVTIKVEVTENINAAANSAQPSGGAQDVRLFRNGLLVKFWRGDVFDRRSGCVPEPNNAAKRTVPSSTKPRRVVCTETVSIVGGDNEFFAYAFNRDNLKSDDSKILTVNDDRIIEHKGTLYILAIGINDYQSKNNNLNFAVADVEEVSKEFKAQQDQLANYSHTKIISLVDQLATRDNIMLALRRFADGESLSISAKTPKLKEEIEKINDIQPEDALVLYYAGHGIAVGEHFYLLPHDFKGDGEQSKFRSISEVELNEVLERVNSGKLLMVIDACQSGQALGGQKEGRGPMNSKGLAQLAYDKGMYILTAAQSFQAAKEVSRTQTGKEIKHGLLTFALLEGLSKAKKDDKGRVTERDWMDYAVDEVPQMQIEEMRKRSVAIKQSAQSGERGIELMFVEGDSELDPAKRHVQRPRVFYRRELEAHPLIVARP